MLSHSHQQYTKNAMLNKYFNRYKRESHRNSGMRDARRRFQYKHLRHDMRRSSGTCFFKTALTIYNYAQLPQAAHVYSILRKATG